MMSDMPRTDAEEEFIEWFAKNYPGPSTIISNPNWHAPKIFRAATRQLERDLAAARAELAALRAELAKREKDGHVWTQFIDSNRAAFGGNEYEEKLISAGTRYITQTIGHYSTGDRRFTIGLFNAMLAAARAATPEASGE